MTIWEQVRWYLLALAILGVSVSLWFNHRTIAEHGRVQAWTVYQDTVLYDDVVSAAYDIHYHEQGSAAVNLGEAAVHLIDLTTYAENVDNAPAAVSVSPTAMGPSTTSRLMTLAAYLNYGAVIMTDPGRKTHPADVILLEHFMQRAGHMPAPYPNPTVSTWDRFLLKLYRMIPSQDKGSLVPPAF